MVSEDGNHYITIEPENKENIQFCMNLCRAIDIRISPDSGTILSTK